MIFVAAISSIAIVVTFAFLVACALQPRSTMPAVCCLAVVSSAICGLVFVAMRGWLG